MMMLQLPFDSEPGELQAWSFRTTTLSLDSGPGGKDRAKVVCLSCFNGQQTATIEAHQTPGGRKSHIYLTVLNGPPADKGNYNWREINIAEARQLIAGWLPDFIRFVQGSDMEAMQPGRLRAIACVCRHCGKEFKSASKRARFCCGAHKVAHFRANSTQ